MGSHRVGHDWSDLATAAARADDSLSYIHVMWRGEETGEWHGKQVWCSGKLATLLAECPKWSRWEVQMVFLRLIFYQECLGAASLCSSVRFFIPGPPVALALGQFSNKVSPSKSPLPIAFPDLLCHRHFSTSLAFFTPPEANQKLGIWSRNLIWKMISGSMMQKCGSETLMGENSMKLV